MSGDSTLLGKPSKKKRKTKKPQQPTLLVEVWYGQHPGRFDNRGKYVREVQMTLSMCGVPVKFFPNSKRFAGGLGERSG